ncbi:hypothetical protein INT48_009220 [Thamnidium elegans]|uniref:MIT domain-containing protein n=1 Tax=Thamnidium elegans TaxID=101142 RepID=A0A8H7VZP6_9FUNG|nr:hypothetical protein INT48_009220 [Thamnidium elegans]
MMNNASTWFPSYRKEQEAELHRQQEQQQQQQQQQDEDNFNAYRRLTPPGSPRYSMAPPPYEAAPTQPIVSEKRFSNTLSTIWKRASFSSYAGTDIKTPLSAVNSTIDKKQMEHAVTLINVATDMNNSGNQQMAIDLYMMGLDKLISALPLKESLEKKLVELKERHKLSLVSLNDLLPEEEEEEEGQPRPIRAQISNLVINAAVLNALSSVMNYAVDGIQTMDEKHQIRQRTWDLAAKSVGKAVQIDRQFEIHQMVTGAFYTGFTAFVKAGLAYAETATD